VGVKDGTKVVIDIDIEDKEEIQDIEIESSAYIK